MPDNPLDWTNSAHPQPQFLGPPLQAPLNGGFGNQPAPGNVAMSGGNNGFGWRQPGRRFAIPFGNDAIGMPNNEQARQQAIIAQAIAANPQFQGQMPAMPQMPQGLDPIGYAGGQIGAHGPPLYQGNSIIKSNG